jgi:TolB-like protein/Tfp pilus assembly protein PilF
MQPANTHHSNASIAAADIRAELRRVLCSQEFEPRPQLQRFLLFIVEEEIAGRGDRLKEYVIGTEVFGRPSGYDPRLDSLVRVEARRLRNALDIFYANEGRQDTLRIEIQKGSYIPWCRIVDPPTAVDIPVATPPPPAHRRSRRIWLWFVVAAAALIIIPATVIFTRHRTRESATHTVAILPFENLSSDPENEYLCFGIVDEIATELAKSERVRVIARTSASQFSRKDDVASIGRQLKADSIVEGSLSRSGNSIHINVQLINVFDSVHLWAQSYQRDSADPLQIQNEVARAIARGIAASLGVASGANALTPRYSSSPEANELYWKGVYLRTGRGKEHWRENLIRSADFLERAVQRDNRFGPAYAALSDVYMNLAFESNGGTITTDYSNRARDAGTRAIELDHNSSDAYCSLAVIQAFYDWDWLAAEKNFRRALQLNPSNAWAHSWYGMALLPQRRYDEAIEQAKFAMELDPLSFEVNNFLGVTYYLARSDKLAMETARQTIQLDPRFSAAYALTGMVYEQQHKYALAIAEYQKGLRITPEHSFLQGRLGHALAKAGHRQEATKVLNEMVSKRDFANLSDLHIAYVYAGLGDLNGLFAQLDRACSRRDPDLPYLNADPILDEYRTDPRFAEMVSRLRLPN